MTCRCCTALADVAVHVAEPGEPLLYCDPCRVANEPEKRFTITDELRLTRHRSFGPTIRLPETGGPLGPELELPENHGPRGPVIRVD